MPELIPQSAALPHRDGRICMVTSRNRARWVIPKGRIDRGHTPRETAEVEAWEEAGLVGTIITDVVGTYRYEKFDRKYNVSVFVLDVTIEHPTWPESNSRIREWLTIAEALKRIDEPGLRAILRSLAEPGELLGPQLITPQFVVDKP